ncbi:hypothetical protein TUM3792_43190 [Shewanella sp. MBTL60-007]|nr:hypothetical protein TUM3792_43190 [Shewanella sp. MBTL60-007]
MSANYMLALAHYIASGKRVGSFPAMKMQDFRKFMSMLSEAIAERK